MNITLDKLQETLTKVENWILTLEWVAVILLSFYAIQILHHLFAVSSASLFDTLGRVGILISVLLASQVARRQLTFAQIVEKKKQIDNNKRITSHLLAICKDMIARFKYLGESLESSGKSTSFIVANIEVIKERNSVFYDRDIFEVLPSELFSSVSDIAGQMFSLFVFTNDLTKSLEEHKIYEIDLKRLSPEILTEIQIATSTIRKILTGLNKISEDLSNLMPQNSMKSS